MIMSKDAENTFDEIHYPLMKRTLSQLEMEGSCLSDEGHLQDLAAHIIFNGEVGKCFPPYVENKARIFALTTSVQYCT